MHTERRSIEWDSRKAAANLRKHGVDLADAVSALEDDRALTVGDPDAERDERYVSVGRDARGRVLVTVFAVRGESVRLISSRRASPGERRQYEAS